MVLAPYQKAVGRPPTITLESVGAIIADVRFGLTFYTASRGQGLSYHRALRWKREGERLMALDEWNPALMTEAQCLYFLLAQGVGMAQAALEREQIEGIKRDGEGDWRSHAWLLERYLPEEWGSPPYQLKVLVDRLQQDLFELLTQQNKQEDPKPWTTPEMTVNMLRQLRQLGLMTREQAKITEELEQELVRRGHRLVSSILPEGVEPVYLEGTSRVPDPLEKRSRQVERAGRQAAIQVDDQPAQASMALDQEPTEPTEDELLALGKRLCGEGTHVGRQGRMETCIGCGLTQSRPLRLVEEFV